MYEVTGDILRGEKHYRCSRRNLPGVTPDEHICADLRNKDLDSVNHPAHYTQHPSGVECIQISEGFNFNLGNVIKYVWRAGLKLGHIEDLQKARFYLDREISRLTKENVNDPPST